MKTILLSTLAAGLFFTGSAHAQSKPTPGRDASRATRDQKIERTKVELKEIGQDVKEKAKVVGKAVGTEAEKASEAIERRAQERKAKRGTARRDTV